jgi:hypothetical protein
VDTASTRKTTTSTSITSCGLDVSSVTVTTEYSIVASSNYCHLSKKEETHSISFSKKTAQ